MDRGTLLQQAREALEAGRAEEAVGYLREVLQGERANPAAHHLLGVALTRTGDTAGAIQALDRAHYLRPDDAQVLVDYGKALVAEGRDEDARFRFEAALRLNPDLPEALAQLGGLYARLAGAPAAAPPPPPRPSPATAARPAPPAPVATSPRPTPPTLPREPRAEPARFPPPPQQQRPASPFTGAPPQPEDFSRWEPETLPRFGSLVRAVLQLWGQQPLVWLLLLGVPNAVAALVRVPRHARWLAALAWIVALGFGAAPTLVAMANQWMYGRVGGRRQDELPGAIFRALGVSLPYTLVALAPFAVALALRSVLSPAVIVLAVLLSTAPFHALLAPAMAKAAGEGPGGLEAVRKAWGLAGKRAWLHLGLIALIGVGAAALLILFGWGFAVTLRGQGESVQRVMEAAGLSLGESVWAALITVCGLDSISSAEAEAAGYEADGEEMPPDGPPAVRNGALQRRGE